VDIDEKLQIDRYFEGLNVDYSLLQCSLPMAKFIANFISNHVEKDIPLQLIPHGLTSVRHDLKLVRKDLVLLKFGRIVGQYAIETICDDSKVVIKIPHRDTFLNYISEIIKNIAFFNYLIFEETTYYNVNQFTYSDLSKILNIYAKDNADLDYGTLRVYDDSIWYKLNRYSLSISIKINKYSTSFYLGDKNFKTFNDLIYNINQYLYKSVVESVIDIPSSEFTFRHRELLKMATI